MLQKKRKRSSGDRTNARILLDIALLCVVLLWLAYTASYKNPFSVSGNTILYSTTYMYNSVKYSLVYSYSSLEVLCTTSINGNLIFSTPNVIIKHVINATDPFKKVC